MKKILFLVPLLFCLIVTSVFANDVTVRMCIEGDSSNIWRNSWGEVRFGKVWVPLLVGAFDLGYDGCFERTKPYKKM